MRTTVLHPVGREGVLVSSYAASPAHRAWNPLLERELLASLCALPDVVGLEVPWLGRIHPHDDGWFLENVPSGARLSLTPLPYVMQRCAAEPGYGIASAHPAGRSSALDDLRRLADDVRVLTERSGAEVAFVSLHTAPSGAADATALADSLRELAGLDWCGAQLVIEHCDAPVTGRPFEKGFLRVEDEIAAIAETSAPIGVWLNWGRSAIELRDPDAVTAQIADVAASGYLTGLTLSGAAATDGPYGAAWTDAHLPLLGADPDSASLLDDAHVHAAISAAGTAPWLGVKVSRHPNDHTAREVVDTVMRNLAIIRSALPKTDVVPVARQFESTIAAIGKAMPSDIGVPGGVMAYRQAARARATTADAVAARYGLTHHELVVAGLPVTAFRPTTASNARVVFLHGGGLIAGDRFDGADVVARHARSLGFEIWSVEYPLAPENDFDTIVESVLAVARASGEDGGRVLVAGQSAGGGIAAEVAIRAAATGVRTDGQLLVCPMLSRADDMTASAFHNDRSWSAANNAAAWAAALGDGAVVPPGERLELPKLSPTYLDAGSAELFRDAITDFATTLWRSGNRAELHVWSGGFHGFDSAAEDAVGSAEAHRVRGEWMSRWLGGQL